MFAATVLGPAHASTVYKWVDSRGVVNYSTAPPPEARGIVAVNADPSISGREFAGDDEARYWRERRQRDAANELANLRHQRETEEWRQARYRQQMMQVASNASAEDERRRQAREQCVRERRVDCDTAGATAVYGGYYPAPVIARAPRQTIQQVSPFPVTGATTGPAPGTIAGTQSLLAPSPVAAVTPAGLATRRR
jgi:hypothetical protein